MNMNRISASINSDYHICKRCAASVTLLNAAFAAGTYHSKQIIQRFAFCKAEIAFLRIAKMKYARQADLFPIFFSFGE